MSQSKGLTTLEAKKLLLKYGENRIKITKKVSLIKIFISQFTSPIILLLILTAIISFFIDYFNTKNYLDSILILIIIFIAGLSSFAQNYKAEKIIKALKKMISPDAIVIRDGYKKNIRSYELVPSDIVIVEAGDIAPADIEILKGTLEVNESTFTGESKLVKKKNGAKIFSGCGINSGYALTKVFATGDKTKIGKIANKMQQIHIAQSPFQFQMEKLTRKIVVITSLIIVLTFAIGLKKFGIIEASLIAVSLAVAAIPEDLPAIITIGLSLGANKMAKKKALVRHLSTIESIGSIDTICTDKTGTLTEGKMRVKELWSLQTNEEVENLAKKCCYYCNDAKEIFNNNIKKWVGNETDIALKQYSLDFVEKEKNRSQEISFTSEKKMMTVVIDEKIIFSKGAPEVILEKCNKIFLDKTIELDKNLKERIIRKNREFTSKGYRTLALAYKPYSKALEEDLIFISLIILSDPLRKGVKQAIADCYSAGIRIIMITGDDPLTAKAIAREAGMSVKDVIIGSHLDKMSDKELAESLKTVNIFARATAFHKLKILNILQKQHIVAMTGDGVNDALALKKADIGIAMGIRGTEIAKEASDIILLDDNFTSIRDFIKQGRSVFDNIQRAVNYLLSCNIAEVIVILFTTLTFSFIPLYPIQILWINLITDGLPALALITDPVRKDIMFRLPHNKNNGIIDKRLLMFIIITGIKNSLIILGTFLIVLTITNNQAVARTALFTGFIIYEFVRMGVIEYNEKLVGIEKWALNKLLIYGLTIPLILQIIIIYTPLSYYFNVVQLGIQEWFILIIGSLIGFILGIGIVRIVDKTAKNGYNI